MRQIGVSRLRMIERRYLRGRLLSETPPRWAYADDVGALAKDHVAAIAEGAADMIEIEFPDLPLHRRFFRIGTNPALMALPEAIK
jgi:hypothetical protein